jgi:hypothetical protein
VGSNPAYPTTVGQSHRPIGLTAWHSPGSRPFVSDVGESDIANRITVNFDGEHIIGRRSFGTAGTRYEPGVFPIRSTKLFAITTIPRTSPLISPTPCSSAIVWPTSSGPHRCTTKQSPPTRSRNHSRTSVSTSTMCIGWPATAWCASASSRTTPNSQAGQLPGR